MSEISCALQAVLARIASAATACGRDPATVQLLAVSKTKPLAAVTAALAAGQQQFGENYVQEGVDKIVTLTASAVLPQPVWHFIGPLQSNKTRPVAEHFDWVHSIERLKIAERLSQQRPAHLPPLQVCVQVNVSQEASKSGCALEEAAALCHAVAALPNLQLRGLMAIPAPVEAENANAADAAATLALQRAPFARLRELYEQLRRDGLALDTLSMGMSDDLEAAIMEGATLVRVGTAIFGARNYA